ncbi:MAG: hypothetical protein HUU41_21970 [Bryobacteraceae bacterium]|nr:hypothetical protein [Bryobacteraceae bacterium]
MAWTALTFGQYAGKTLPQVVLSDPDYFFWGMEQGIFKGRGALESEAKDIFHKATHIKIPANNLGELCVEYWFDPNVGKFSHFDIVPADRGAHQGSSPTTRSELVDMSLPRQCAEYDKTGGKALIKSLKYHVFGDENIKLTKARCEAFFDNNDNFLGIA